MRSTRLTSLLAAALTCAFAARTALAQSAPKMKMTTDIPPGIAMPDKVETRLGTLKFFDGFPDDATVEKLYDNLDFQRAVQAYLLALAPVNMAGLREGLLTVGPANTTIPTFEANMNARSIFLTANATTPYTWVWINLHDGPLVAELPPLTLGMIDDFWFRYVTDIGILGPDKGKGGKYLLLPPGYQGEVPAGYFVVKVPTFESILVWRNMPMEGGLEAAIKRLHENTRIYPLSEAANPRANTFVNVSDRAFSTVAPADYRFWELLDDIVQKEPVESSDPVTLGFFASIGIEKGKPFAPDARMKKILHEAAAVGDATVRAITYRSRIPEAFYYPDSTWRQWLGGYKFESQPGVSYLDAAAFFYFYATGVTPAMEAKFVGQGFQYAVGIVDSKGKGLDGGKTYRLHLAPGVPVKDFWSAIVYDNQTRSMLQTDQDFPQVSSLDKGLVTNADGSVDVYFGPKPPAGMEDNWIQTLPGKGWNMLFRLYGPLEPWFDKTWKLNEIEEVKVVAATSTSAAEKSKMSTDIPPGIAIPDQVDTRLGTLKFFDGFPDDATVEKLYDNLDFQRAVQAYLLAIPAVNQAAMRKALLHWGPANTTMPIWEDLVFPRTVGLTFNTSTPYAWMWIDLHDGPLVAEVPPGVLGAFNDHWYRWVVDVGVTGPDKGQGGKYLILPPGYEGEVPEGYFVARAQAYEMFLAFRTFPDKTGNLKPHVELTKQRTKVYPLAQAANPPAMKFVNISPEPFVTVGPGDDQFWELLDGVVQSEPPSTGDPVTLGFFAAIGIEHGKPFAPDARMKKILTEAAEVGDATARTLTYRMRDKEAYYNEGSAWRTAFLGGYSFSRDGIKLLDSASQYYFYATGVTPAMEAKMVGSGSQYALAFVDAKGRPLDGGRTYRLHVPAKVPINNFWSVIAYDNQTRSFLQTDQTWPSVTSKDKDFHTNADGSVDVYFAPERPKDAKNFIQTLPGKGWNAIFRLYGPLEPWFDKSWRLGEIELVP